MPTASASSASQSINPEANVAVEVSELLRALPSDGMPLRRLGKLSGASPAAICLWQRGTRRLTPSQQRKVQEIVRAEFARHVARVAELAERHGVGG